MHSSHAPPPLGTYSSRPMAAHQCHAPILLNQTEECDLDMSSLCACAIYAHIKGGAIPCSWKHYNPSQSIMPKQLQLVNTFYYHHQPYNLCYSNNMVLPSTFSSTTTPIATLPTTTPRQACLSSSDAYTSYGQQVINNKVCCVVISSHTCCMNGMRCCCVWCMRWGICHNSYVVLDIWVYQAAAAIDHHHHHHTPPPSYSQVVNNAPLPSSSSSRSPPRPCPRVPPAASNRTCYECNHTFTRPRDLRRHLEQSDKHNAVRKVQCALCLKSFTREDVMRRHCGRKRCLERFGLLMSTFEYS